MAKIECYTCRDKGLEGGCPDCLKEKEIDNLKLEMSDEEVRELKIPDFYVDRYWNSEILVREYPNQMDNIHFNKYIEILNRVDSIFKKGVIPGYSIFIISPRKFGKKVFAYSCMQYAIKAGYSAFALIDTNELKAILNSDGGYLKLSTDVLFITVTESYNRRSSWEVILQILDIRSRKGLSTFILSAFSLAEISGWDSNGRFNVVDINKTGDPKRYPRIIAVEDESMYYKGN